MTTPFPFPGAPKGVTTGGAGIDFGPILTQILVAAGPQVMNALVGLLVQAVSHAMAPKPIPPAPETSAAPVQPTPTSTPVPQVPIVAPTKTITSVALILSSVEKPARVGGGPGINYDDPRGMVASGNAFNYGCVAILYGKAFDQNGDEYMGPDIVAADLEFRTKWRVYKGGQLVAFMEGEGDTNPRGEGEPAPWHQSGSGDVNFGFSRWRNSAGFDNRLTFVGQGDFEIELTIGGVTAPRIPFRVS